MSEARETFYLRGKAFWCKLLPDQLHLNYDKDGKEWSVDFSLDKEGLAKMKTLGMTDRIKDKSNEQGRYIVLRVRELRKDGKANDLPKIVDSKGNPWPEDKRIGNESIVDVKLNYVGYGARKKPGLYMQSMRVLEWVPYESTGFKPLEPDDEYFGKGVVFKQGGGAEAKGVEAAWGDAEDAPFDDDDDDDDDLNDEVPM